MKIRKVGIARARIDGLYEGNFSWVEEFGLYTTNILLKQNPKDLFKNLASISCGRLSDAAQKYQSKLIQQFDSAEIHDGDEVVVLFEKVNSNVIAVGKPNSNKWIDVNDDFKVKVFNDFNFFISDLTVY